MSGPVKPDDIDAVIHERVRLAIVAALAVSPQLSFTELKSMLELTDGNLSAHSRTLDEAGYKTVADLAREDPDRLAIRTGLGIKKARQVQTGAVYFLENEAKEIEEARVAHAAKLAAAPPAPAPEADAASPTPTTETPAES